MNRFVVLLVSLAAAGCAGGDDDMSGGTSGGTPPSAAAAESAQIAKAPAADPAHLVFIDSATFDSDLSETMRGRPREIVVNVPASFSLNKIPPRVDKWLYAIKDSGGKVVATPEEPPATRGIASIIIDVIVSIFDRVREAEMYEPTERYNGTLLYGKDGTVKTIRFVQR